MRLTQLARRIDQLVFRTLIIHRLRQLVDFLPQIAQGAAKAVTHQLRPPHPEFLGPFTEVRRIADIAKEALHRHQAALHRQHRRGLAVAFEKSFSCPRMIQPLQIEPQPGL